MTSDSSNEGPDIADPQSELIQNAFREITLDPKPLVNVWSGIVLAATCYPVVLVGLVSAVYTVSGSGPSSLSYLGVLLLFALASQIIGLLYGIFMSGPAFVLAQVLRWSLKGIISGRGASGIFGGMTGFLCVSGGGLFYTSGMPPLHAWQAWGPVFLTSLLAVVMGYVGAIWMGYRKQTVGFPFFEPIFSFEKQITIAYLMKLTFVVAAISVVFKAAGPAGLGIGIAWLVYLPVQTLLLVCDHWFTLWLSHR